MPFQLFKYVYPVNIQGLCVEQTAEEFFFLLWVCLGQAKTQISDSISPDTLSLPTLKFGTLS